MTRPAPPPSGKTSKQQRKKLEMEEVEEAWEREGDGYYLVAFATVG
jgi:hypothetical protein